MSTVVPKHRCLVLRRNGATSRPDEDMIFSFDIPVPTVPPLALEYEDGTPLQYDDDSYVEYDA